ncbi:MAG: hypothetical protein ACO34J_09620 [Prochlorothrix sp.]
MDLNHPTFAQCMAFLVAIPPDSRLAQLFRFCLATQLADDSSSQAAHALVQKFIQDPAGLPYWSFEAMSNDSRFTAQEWEELEKMQNTNTNAFIRALKQKLAALDF